MLIDAGIMNFVEVDLATLRHGRTFIGFTTASPLWSATYSPSGQMIVVTDRTSLTLFDTRTGQLRGTIARQDWVDAWRLSPDEHYLAVVDGSGTISVINALTLRPVWSTTSDQYPISTAVADNASASVAGNCRWTIFDRHGFMTRSIPIDGVIASDGRHIARSTQNGTFIYRLS